MDFDNKYVIVFYHDGNNVSRKEGICIKYDFNAGILLINGIFIPVRRIVRIEIKEEKDV